MKGLLRFFLQSIAFFQKVKRSITGRSETDEIHEKVVSGKAWEEFCDHLKAAGASILYPGTPSDPVQQAEGLRYLTRLTRAGLEAFVEHGDPAFPVLRRTVHETIKMGADNPDNYYLNAQISGEYEYVIEGNRRSIDYVGFFTQNGNYGTTGGLAPCGVLEGSELIIEGDGNFIIHLSRESKGQNWLRIAPETSLLMVRQTFRNREIEKPMDLKIRAIGVSSPGGNITPERLVQGLNTAGLFIGGAPLLFSKWAKGFQKHTNQLPLFDPEVSNSAGGDKSIIYYHSHWKLEHDEVLEITVYPPECDNWNFQLNNYWMESLDYRYHRICINADSAMPEIDGTVKVLISQQSIDHPNYLTTAEHREGTMCWRWYRPTLPAEQLPEPKTRVLKIDQIN